MGLVLDTEFTTRDLQDLVRHFKREIRHRLGVDFPVDPHRQLWGAIGAVFGSWMNPRAEEYRRLNGIPSSWGTAVNVQAMVFGNMGPDSGSGVAFTRDAATGEKCALWRVPRQTPRGRMWCRGPEPPPPLRDWLTRVRSCMGSWIEFAGFWKSTTGTCWISSFTIQQGKILPAAMSSREENRIRRHQDCRRHGG